ncbi:LLM class flavin-dependent oxidoreductase [Streptomyces sp. 21So2-11]|uniref:LLM class flavin-dependent oxidoreductase n=1 Tax=Streptomyces sp. 21So2-11 TaxID=3144408 RepID=UPI00321C278B
MAPSPTALDRLVSSDGRLTVGLELPLDSDWGTSRLLTDRAAGRSFGVPALTEHSRLAQLADRLGFAALWVRDVPLFDVEHFGDAGSVFETFTHLGHLAATTHRAVLGTAAAVLPLREPLLVAPLRALSTPFSPVRQCCTAGVHVRQCCTAARHLADPGRKAREEPCPPAHGQAVPALQGVQEETPEACAPDQRGPESRALASVHVSWPPSVQPAADPSRGLKRVSRK